MQGLVVFGIAWAITSGALVVLHATTPDASHGAEIAVLTGANLFATLVRFVLFKAWVFRAGRRGPELIRPGTTPATSAGTASEPTPVTIPGRTVR